MVAQSLYSCGPASHLCRFAHDRAGSISSVCCPSAAQTLHARVEAIAGIDDSPTDSFPAVVSRRDPADADR
jgi:hypothetical protein